MEMCCEEGTNYHKEQGPDELGALVCKEHCTCTDTDVVAQKVQQASEVIKEKKTKFFKKAATWLEDHA